MNAPFCRGLVGALGLLGAALAWGWPTPAPLFPNYCVFYDSPATYATPVKAVMDFDGDGDVDVLVAEYGSDSESRLQVWTNVGAGRFALSRLVPVSGISYSSWPGVLRMADLGGDGRPELVSRLGNSVIIRTLRPGEAPIRETRAIKLALHDIALADLTADGRPELLALAEDRLRVFYNDGTGYFQGYADYALGHDVSACVVADISGDGRVDLAIADRILQRLFVWTQTPDGAFEEQGAYDLGPGPWSLAAGDMNGDGRADLGIASAATPGVVVRYGRFGGGLSPAQVVDPDAVGGVLEAADMDADGDADLVGTFAATGIVRIWHAAGEINTPLNAHRIEAFNAAQVADVNGDAMPDVLIMRGSPWPFQVLLNDRTGGLETGILAELPVANAIGVGDADGDGDSDFVRAIRKTGNDHGRIVLYDNNGDGQLTEIQTISVPYIPNVSFTPNSIMFGYFNHDHDTDIAIGDTANGVWMLRRDGAEYVLEPPVAVLDRGCYLNAVSDVDLDGHDDLLGGLSSGSYAIVILRSDPVGFAPTAIAANSPLRAFASDLNGDGYPEVLGTTYSATGFCMNHGDGTFGALTPVQVPQYGAPLINAAAGDIDRDGDADLVGGRRYSSGLYLFVNSGDATFSQELLAQGHPPMYCPRILDVDDDAFPDIADGVFTTADWHAIWLNDRRGGFHADYHDWPNDPNYYTPYTLARFDDDDLPDLVHRAPDSYQIIRNLGGGTYVCRGDVNCDGMTTLADIDPFVSALSGGTWPHCPRANADISGDGTVTFADIDPFVALLGQDQDCDADGFADRCMIAARLVDDCDGNGVPDTCDLAAGAADCNANGVLDACEVDCNSNGIPDDCDIAAGALDCDGNRVPDACEPDCDGNGQTDACQLGPQHHNDCNQNGRLDACDIAVGFSADCTGNGTPDECEPDCNGNGTADSCDLLSGFSPDCNGNGYPDECDITDLHFPDCNGNGVPDACDLASGTSPDCNHNLKPDECDLANGLGDCDSDGVLDVCDPDCNGNGRSDHCDLLVGSSFDCNGGGIPDECELQPLTTFHQLFTPLGGQPHALTLVAPPPATSPVEITGQASGDLAYTNEFVTVMIGGVATGVLFESGFQCAVITEALVVPAATWNAHMADGDVTLTFVPSAAVNPAACGGSTWLDVTVRYHYSQDLDADGALDLCYCRGDANCDGSVTFADIEPFVALLGMPATGVSATGCPLRNADANGDGIISFADIDPLVDQFGTSCR